MFRNRSIPLLSAFALLAACGDGTGPDGPASVGGISGNSQTATVATALPNPIAVRVTDSGGGGVAGVDVAFEMQTGGGSLAADRAGELNAGGRGGLARVVVTTDSDGEAEASWMLGQTAGKQEATATVTGISPFTFTATATPDAAASVEVASGDDQAGLLGSPLSPHVAKVSDRFGNGVPGVSVAWAITVGTGALSAMSSTSDASGEASTTLTPTQLGASEVTATAGSLAPAIFEAVAVTTATILDPAGDEFSTGASAGLVPPDITRLTAWPSAGNLMVVIDFVNDVKLDVVGGPNEVYGFLDIDADQNPATGTQARTDEFGGSTGMGMDFWVQLWTAGSGVMSIADSNGVVVGTFTSEVSANVLRMVIPLSLIGGDEGLVDLAMLVGTSQEETDIAPDTGVLSMAPDRVTSAAERRRPVSSVAEPRLDWKEAAAQLLIPVERRR